MEHDIPDQSVCRVSGHITRGEETALLSVFFDNKLPERELTLMCDLIVAIVPVIAKLVVTL